MLRISLTSLLTGAAVLAATPAHAQFGGGKPKIPDARVLDTYDQVVIDENLQIAPVSAGLTGGTIETDDLVDAGLNPENYSGTLKLLQQYMNRIAEMGPRKDVIPKVTLKLALLADASTPSRDEVVITTGLVDILLKSQASERDFQSALAFILAHEYGHVLYDHPTLFAQKEEESKNLSKAISTALVYTSQMQSLAAKVSPDLAKANMDASNVLASASSLSPYVEMEMYRVSVAPYRREQESLADFMSTDLMRQFTGTDQEYAAIMNPHAGMQALSVFQDYDNSIAGQLSAGLKHLQDEMKTAGKEIEGQAQQLATDFNTANFLSNVQGSIAKGALNFLVGIVSRRFDKDKIHLHYSSEKRIEGVDEYLTTFYDPIPEFVDGSDFSGFEAFSGFPTAEQMGKTFTKEYAPDKASQTAKLALLNDDVAGARAAMDAVDASKVTSAYFHAIDGTVWQRMGEYGKAEQSYGRAIKLPEAGLQSYRDLETVQVIQAKYDAAWKTLDLAEAKFGATSIIVDRIQLLVAQEKIDEAKALAATCESYGNDDLTKQCERALPEEEDEDEGLKLPKIF